MKVFRCGDVIPLCDWHYMSDSEEDMLAHIKEHAEQVHGLRQVTPALMRAVKESIREVA